jgi:hypothetical protein
MKRRQFLGISVQWVCSGNRHVPRGYLRYTSRRTLEPENERTKRVEPRMNANRRE